MPPEITLRRYRTGATIVKKGEPAVAVYIVVRGRVAIERDGRHDTGGAAGELGPGEMFGELASLPGARYHATARALTDTLCVIVPVEKLPELGDALH